jgi:pimeloyl-ACP methyl ester carboxylesterase
LLLAIAGMFYETLSRHYATTSIPAPGVMIELGGRGVHLDCRGQGAPTVVLESGLDQLGSLSWSKVHEPLSRLTRVCAYDRAGVLWSDAQHARRDAVAVALELRALLHRAKEPGPYVMVSHSFGAAYALLFTAMMKSEVRALLLIEAAHPDQDERFAAAFGGTEHAWWTHAYYRLLRALGPFWTTVGVARLQGVMLPRGVDEESARIANAFGPSSREALWAEESALKTSLREAGAVRKLGDRWLTVLTADPPDDQHGPNEPDARGRPVWLALQADMAHWSTRSEHTIVRGSRHHIQLSHPGAVIHAVRELVLRVRNERDQPPAK